MRNQNFTKNGFLKYYKHRVWDFLECFSVFNIQSIPRKENRHANILAAVSASYDVPRSLKDKKRQKIKMVVKISIGKSLNLMHKF